MIAAIDVTMFLWTIHFGSFFYDKQHESGNNMDDVDLALQRSVDKQTWINFKTDNRLDEKLKVNVEDVPGGYYWLFEDSDRDDSDGPGTEIDTE